ncbi:MAG TPA: regulatory protein RecX [Longimicrobiaceae bacterium]|nr:regulatory protein RecX [Longimicrobiaceae bacterium]
MKITAIEPQKSNAERVNVHVDGAFRLALGAEVAFNAWLHVGDDVTEERLTELERQDTQWRAREAALALLSFRPRTAAELRRRLVEKEFPPEVAAEVVDRLDEMKLVDDSAFAEMFVRDRVRLKPKGKRMLAQELRVRGVDADTARDAIDGVLERADSSEADLARQAAAKWKPRAGEEPRKARARLYAFLARRGFGGDAIRAAADDVLRGVPDGGDPDEDAGDA